MTDHTTPSEAKSPREVAKQWVRLVGARDANALFDLYEVGAALHTADSIVLGREQIAEAMLAMSASPEAEATIDGNQGGMVTLTWPSATNDRAESTRLRVRRGKIVEQWIGERHSRTGQLAAVPIEMSTSGDVSPEEHDLVWDMVDDLVSLRDEKASHISVRLSRQAKRGPNTVELRVNMTLSGGSVRATERGSDVRSVAIIVEQRLKQALHRRVEKRFDSHQQPANERPLPGAVDTTKPRTEREIVRHKTVSPAPSTLEEATFDLVSMDYDFYLYVDLESNRDAVVAKSGDSFTNHIGPSRASLASARDRLHVGNEPFVFFEDEDTHRGHVLYRRFDGHFGLIVPADD